MKKNLLLIFLSISTYSQTIKGTITDSTGVVPFVNLLIKKTDSPDLIFQFASTDEKRFFKTMKKEILLILLFITIKVNSQNYNITYNLEQVAKNINLTTNIKTYLSGNKIVSIYVEDYRNSYEETDENSNMIKMPTEKNPTYFKDLKNNIVTYNDHIKFNFFNIKDSVGNFEWKLASENKKILDYNCQKATLNFRGRDFTVFFTSEISISDGPLKFSGLPGLILEIYSDDSVASFHYLAESVRLYEEYTEIEDIYENKETITYNDYLKKYKTKYEESLSKIINDKGETRPMSKGFMEVLINE